MNETNAELLNLLQQLATQKHQQQEQVQYAQPIVTTAPATVPALTSSIPDASTITTYTLALQHIVRYIAPNESIVSEIRLMIQDQARKEQELYNSRVDLINKQESRSKGRQELEKVLTMVGAYVTTKNNNNDDYHNSENSEEYNKTNEMNTFDFNLYRQWSEYMTSQHEQLADLQVPLFCIRKDLPRTRQLQEDRKKLLQFLVDLCL